MGVQTIRQPNGRLAVFSDTNDMIVLHNATREEVIKLYVEERECERREVESMLDLIEAGNAKQVYGKYTMSWEAALESDEYQEGEVWRHYAS